MRKIEQYLIYMYVKNGVSYKRAANAYGVSRQIIYQIVQRYGYRKNNRNLKKINLNKAELYVMGKLKKLDFAVEGMPYGSPYDLLVNGEIKIEVKHRVAINKKLFYEVGNLYKENFDFIIIVLGKLNDDPICYVMPRLQTRKFMTFSSTRKNKSKKDFYRENWAILL